MKLICILLSLISLNAYADILYLDINNTESEYKAAVEAAGKRNPPEKVWRIPDTTPEQSRIQQDAENKIEEITGKLQKDCPAGTYTDGCRQLQGQLDQANDALAEAVRPSKAQLANFRQRVAELNAQGVKVSSVVISGHDGNGHFSGVYGALNADTIHSVFDQNKNMFQDTRSLLLWGCYTTTPASVDAHWSSVLPNVGVYAGFDRRAPSKLRDASGAYLKDFLMVDKELISARDDAARKEAIAKIHAFNKDSGVEASICLGEFVITPAGEKTRAQILEECRITPEVEKALEVYHCYENASTPECAQPPVNTATVRTEMSPDKCPKDLANANGPFNGDPNFFNSEAMRAIFPACQNPMRSVYEFIQARGDCAPYWNTLIPEGKSMPDLQKVQSLLFYPTIAQNLGSLHRKDLATIDANLRDLGLPGSLMVSDIASLTRAEAKARLAAIRTAIDSRPRAGNSMDQNIKQTLAGQQIREIEEALIDMIETPPTWHGPTTQISENIRNSVSPEAVLDTKRNFYREQLVQKFSGVGQGSGTSTSSSVSAAQTAYDNAATAYQSNPNSAELLAAKRNAQRALNAAKRSANSQDGSKLSIVQGEFEQRKSAGAMDPAEEQAYLMYLNELKSQ